ncbi:dihydrofolate reductase family protein [Brachybacterium alimentarium]|uniref:dihydrofolate reductase family protein n=1 Tax=Brachybacterium alimentarium TaxID=47845 RepID=UPI003FD354BC
MHLLCRDGSPLPQPEAVTFDEAGALALADLYAVPAPPSGTVHVRAMMNTTIDGAVRGADGSSGPLRNPDDSFVFDVLRALTDVVLVGAATVRAEDYGELGGREDLLSSSRRPGGASRPALAIWSISGDLPPLSADQLTYLISPRDSAAAAGRRAGLPASQVITADTPAEALEGLAALGMRAVQAEGGPTVLGRLAAEGLLDELCFSTTHRTVGGDSSRAIHADAHDQRWALSSLLLGEHATITRYRRFDDDHRTV